MREQFKKSMLVGLAIVLSFFTSNFMPVMTAYANTPGGPPVDVCPLRNGMQTSLDDCEEETTDVDNTCDQLPSVTPGTNGWTEKFDEGYPDKVPYTTSGDTWIVAYCVKAGSANQGDGPIIVDDFTPTQSIEIDYPTIDSISHYVVQTATATYENTYLLDCDYLLTGTQITYVGEAEVDSEALTPRTITAEEAERLGVALPQDCEDDTPVIVEPLITSSHQTSVCTEGEEVFTSGYVTLGAVEGLHYSIDGSIVTGTVNLAPGVHEIEFSTDTGYVLADGVANPRTITIEAAADLNCPMPDSDSVTLCHATGSTKNPFVLITVDAEGAYNGHLGDDHQEGRDIIPEFWYDGEQYSQNWTEGMIITDKCAPSTEQPCILADQRYTSPWMYGGYSNPDTNVTNGYLFTSNGLELSTPTVPDYVSGLIDAGETRLIDVDAMSYETFRKAASAGYEFTVPAYILEIDTNGTDIAGGVTYLFYEPYNNSPPTVTEDAWQTWDTLNNGEAKWWMWNTGQALRTWDYFVTQYPDAVVLGYGFNQGTYNPETYSIVQSIEFDCATTTFGAAPTQSENTVVTAPTKNDICALVNDTFLIPATTGVNYYINGSTTPATAGIHSTNSALSVTITASAQANYVLTGYPVGGWTLTFTNESCGEVDGITDVCPNITGTQSMIPVGYTKDSNGNCVTGGGLGGGQILGTTLPDRLPATGPVDSAINFVYAILAAIAAYGATYFLQGKRRFEQ